MSVLHMRRNEDTGGNNNNNSYSNSVAYQHHNRSHSHHHHHSFSSSLVHFALASSFEAPNVPTSKIAGDNNNNSNIPNKGPHASPLNLLLADNPDDGELDNDNDANNLNANASSNTNINKINYNESRNENETSSSDLIDALTCVTTTTLRGDGGDRSSTWDSRKWIKCVALWSILTVTLFLVFASQHYSMYRGSRMFADSTRQRKEQQEQEQQKHNLAEKVQDQNPPLGILNADPPADFRNDSPPSPLNNPISDHGGVVPFPLPPSLNPPSSSSLDSRSPPLLPSPKSNSGKYFLSTNDRFRFEWSPLRCEGPGKYFHLPSGGKARDGYSRSFSSHCPADSYKESLLYPELWQLLAPGAHREFIALGDCEAPYHIAKYAADGEGFPCLSKAELLQISQQGGRGGVPPVAYLNSAFYRGVLASAPANSAVLMGSSPSNSLSEAENEQLQLQQQKWIKAKLKALYAKHPSFHTHNPHLCVVATPSPLSSLNTTTSSTTIAAPSATVCTTSTFIDNLIIKESPRTSYADDKIPSFCDQPCSRYVSGMATFVRLSPSSSSSFSQPGVGTNTIEKNERDVTGIQTFSSARSLVRSALRQTFTRLAQEHAARSALDEEEANRLRGRRRAHRREDTDTAAKNKTLEDDDDHDMPMPRCGSPEFYNTPVTTHEFYFENITNRIPLRDTNEKAEKEKGEEGKGAASPASYPPMAFPFLFKSRMCPNTFHYIGESFEIASVLHEQAWSGISPVVLRALKQYEEEEGSREDDDGNVGNKKDVVNEPRKSATTKESDQHHKDEKERHDGKEKEKDKEAQTVAIAGRGIHFFGDSMTRQHFHNLVGQLRGRKSDPDFRYFGDCAYVSYPDRDVLVRVESTAKSGARPCEMLRRWFGSSDGFYIHPDNQNSDVECRVPTIETFANDENNTPNHDTNDIININTNNSVSSIDVPLFVILFTWDNTPQSSRSQETFLNWTRVRQRIGGFMYWWLEGGPTDIVAQTVARKEQDRVLRQHVEPWLESPLLTDDSLLAASSSSSTVLGQNTKQFFWTTSPHAFLNSYWIRNSLYGNLPMRNARMRRWVLNDGGLGSSGSDMNISFSHYYSPLAPDEEDNRKQMLESDADSLIFPRHLLRRWRKSQAEKKTTNTDLKQEEDQHRSDGANNKAANDQRFLFDLAGLVDVAHTAGIPRLDKVHFQTTIKEFGLDGINVFKSKDPLNTAALQWWLSMMLATASTTATPMITPKENL